MQYCSCCVTQHIYVFILVFIFSATLTQGEQTLHLSDTTMYLTLYVSDVKGLKNEDVIRDYQERVCEALLIHTITHYPHIPNKHCELLARLPELTRTCVLAKDQLNARQAAGEVPQFSLLSELLKGDIVVQPSE